MSVLHQARFFTTADALEQLPMLGLPEVAFAGRSNAGKSSAINALTHQKRLAFTSKTPGRTQHINFFAVGTHAEDDSVPAAFLVDLPGYGYAQVGRASKRHWEALLGAYVRQRTELAGIVLIMDARHAMTELDQTLLDWFAATGKPVHALLTKADKLNRSEQVQTLQAARTALSRWHPGHTAQLFSSLKHTGLEEADARVCGLLGLETAPTGALSKKNAPTQGE